MIITWRPFSRFIVGRYSWENPSNIRSGCNGRGKRLLGALDFHLRWTRLISSSSLPLSSNKDSESGILGLAGDYIKKIRWNSAEETVSKLPEDEGNRLMEKTKQERSESDTEGNKKPALGGRNQPSVEELLAEARSKEAERVSAVFEEEMEKREAEMEKAVRKRLESDLELQRRQIAFEKWKEDLEREKQQRQAEGTIEAAATVSTNSSVKSSQEHPILGPLVCDLGHKRVHLSTVERLASLPVWEKQRFFRHDRAKRMAKDKAKAMHTGLPGIIGIYESNDGTLAIIDGQHRIGMLKILADSKDGRNDGSKVDFDRILVEVYSQPEDNTSTSYATEIFHEINKAQPANLVDLPGAVKDEDLEIINNGVATIYDQYPQMFSPSTSCRRPHLNIDNVRNELHLNQVIKRHEIKTADDMAEWIEDRNREMADKYSTDEAQKKMPEKAMEKAKANSFYLGLDRSWYEV